MVGQERPRTGSAVRQGELRGAHARDWADVQEQLVRPLWRAVLDDAAVTADTRLLDVGCGAGGALVLAAERGAAVAGIDASEPLVTIARERLPHGEVRVGEMEELPYADQSFDVVTGYNSFQYAGDPVHALREAGRVAAAGGLVAVATWGRPEQCDAAGHLAALRPLLPASPPGTSGPFALSEPGALEDLAERAGLHPERAADVPCHWEYPDLDTALRGLLSAGPPTAAVRASGEQAVRTAVAASIAPFRDASDGYALTNVFRYLLAQPRWGG